MADRARLLSECIGSTSTGGSNPPLSAKSSTKPLRNQGLNFYLIETHTHTHVYWEAGLVAAHQGLVRNSQLSPSLGHSQSDGDVGSR